MKIQTAFRPVMLSLFGSLLLASVVGCSGVVSEGGSGDGSDGGADASGGAGGTGGGAGGFNAGGANPTGGYPGTGGTGGYCDPGACLPATDAIAMTYAQLDGVSTAASSGSGTATGNSSVTTGGGVDPATQFLKFGAGTDAPSCTLPYGSGGCGGWSATITIAPALFQVGVLPFSDPDVDITVFESVDEGAGQCSGGGGGGFEEGQIEILAIDATSVQFVVSGVNPVFSTNANGTHTALRCQ